MSKYILEWAIRKDSTSNTNTQFTVFAYYKYVSICEMVDYYVYRHAENARRMSAPICIYDRDITNKLQRFILFNGLFHKYSVDNIPTSREIIEFMMENGANSEIVYSMLNIMREEDSRS